MFTPSENVSKIFVSYLKEDGAEQKHNIAPKGPRERRLQALIGKKKDEAEESEDEA